MQRRSKSYMKKLVGIIFFFLLALTLYNRFAGKTHLHVGHQPLSIEDRLMRPGRLQHSWQEIYSSRKKIHKLGIKSHRRKNVKFRRVSSASILPNGFICFEPRTRWPINMFTFASSYGIAKRLNMILVVKTRFLPFFKMKAEHSHVRIVNDTYLCNKAIVYTERNPVSFDNRILTIGSKHLVYLQGFFQSWKYFSGAEKEIRQFFQFSDSLIRTAQENLQSLKSEVFQGKKIPDDLVFVGIHIRRKGLRKRLEEYMAPKGYFKKAMDFFMNNHTKIIFIACTDSPKWAEENIPEFVHFMYTKDPLLQMCVLSQCNHTIMSSGAFGWWSSWLANGITTYYRPPLKATTDLHRFSVRNADHYLPKWIALSGDK